MSNKYLDHPVLDESPAFPLKTGFALRSNQHPSAFSLNSFSLQFSVSSIQYPETSIQKPASSIQYFSLPSAIQAQFFSLKVPFPLTLHIKIV